MTTNLRLILILAFLFLTTENLFAQRNGRAEQKADTTTAFYDQFKKYFHSNIHYLGCASFNESDSIPVALTHSGVKNYARGMLVASNGLSMYVVRREFDNSRANPPSTHYRDILYIADSQRLLPLKPAVVGIYNKDNKNQAYSIQQHYWFDGDNTLHIRSQEKPSSDGSSIPYIKQYERQYAISRTGLTLQGEGVDTLYQPQSYEQLKQLFAKGWTRMAENDFINGILQNDGAKEELIASQLVENYKGLDWFFIQHSYSYIGTGEEDMYNDKDYAELWAFKNGQPFNTGQYIFFNGDMLVNAGGRIGYSYNQDEAIFANLTYSLLPDTSLMLYAEHRVYGNITGYDAPMNRYLELSAALNDKGTIELSGIRKIELSSEFFEGNVDRYTDYPGKENPFNFFDKETDNGINLPLLFPGKALNFYITTSKSGELIRIFELYADKVLQSTYNMESKAGKIINANKRTSPLLAFPVTIKADNGNVILDINGNFSVAKEP